MRFLDKSLLLVKTLENFPTAFLDRLGLKRGLIKYTLRKNKVKFLARAGTEDMAEIVVIGSGSEYRLDRVKFGNFPTIVDLGGHIGSFSIPLALELNQKCKIIVFEPQKGNFELLKKNIKLNRLKSVAPYNSAISDYSGVGILQNNSGNTDSYYLDKSVKKGQKCKVTTLPKILKELKVRKVDLLKIDIEGDEHKLFLHNDTLKYLSKSVSYIYMEYHSVGDKCNFSSLRKDFKNNFRVIYKTGNVVLLKNKK